MTGPFDTDRQARALPEVQAVYGAAHADYDADPGPGKMAPHNRRMLGQALDAAGVELGAYDELIAGWVSRARAAAPARPAAAEPADPGRVSMACDHCDGTGYCTLAGCERCAPWQGRTESSECGACRGTAARVITGGAR